MSTQASTKQEHWASQYKSAYEANSNRTLEGCIYLAACFIKFCLGEDAAEHERVCRGVAQIAFTQPCGIWHASWLFHGKRGECMCAPCTRRVAR